MACVGLAAMREVACCSVCCRLLIWAFRATTWLSIERMMAPRMALSTWSMSTTSGFSVLLFATRLLRWSCLALYSEICDSILEFSMPEFAGRSWLRFESPVR